MFTRERAERAESAQIIVRPHTGCLFSAVCYRSLTLSPLCLYVFLASRSRGSLTSRDMRHAGFYGIPKLDAGLLLSLRYCLISGSPGWKPLGDYSEII